MVLLEEENPTTLKRRKSNIPPTAVLVPHRKHRTAPPTTNNNHNHHHNNHRPPPLTSPASFTGADYELMTLKDSYTSLKDILPSSPSSILSPTPGIAVAGISSSSSGSGYEISIRNRLVKQAAWAYLQPALLSSPSTSTRFFSGDTFRGIFDDFRRLFYRVYDWLVDTLWLILCR